jgi:hypothetical protein
MPAPPRRSESIQYTVNVPTTGDGLMHPDPKRIAVCFNPPVTNRYTITTDTTLLTLDVGITLYPGSDPLILTEREHGEMVRRGWFAISATAAQNVTVVILRRIG